MIPADEKHDMLSALKKVFERGGRQEQFCTLIGVSPRTIQQWKTHGIHDKRKGAEKRVGNKLSQEERENIVKTACSETYRDLPPMKMVATLADTGTYLASESTIYRILREEKLVTRRLRSPSANIPIEIKAEAPDTLWSWDITYLRTMIRGVYFYLYLFVDVWSRAIRGWEIHDVESKEKSTALINRLCAEHKVPHNQLHVRSDNGAAMKNAMMSELLEKLGVSYSFSRPHVSNDNPFSESLFRTLKEHAGYPKAFETIEEAREWVTRFVQWYNHEHKHSRINYVTPMQRHEGKDIDILRRRQEVYAAAYEKHPERWSGNTRNWENRQIIVYLKRPNHIKAA